jgi:glycosyltransferase involved in cell wall biosynthesis
MHIAIITAGGAGMFCGSCMHDNSWAQALIAEGHRVTLIPTYTPIRVDERNVAIDRVFFGGINVYLEARWRWWRWLPGWMKRWLDRPSVISFITKHFQGLSNSATDLGDLTLAILDGESGPLKAAGDELAQFITELQPDAVIFSNALLCGALRRLKEVYHGPVLCILQGDDVFLDELPPAIRAEVVEKMSARAIEFDRILTHTEFYRDYIARYLRLPVEKFSVIPLSINTDDLSPPSEPRADHLPFTIGYFARITPEKGLHHLIEAFDLFRIQNPDARLIVGGYLPDRHRKWFEELQRRAAAWGDAFDYIGSPDTLEAKREFYQSIDVLSVPTEFLEPKGLYVLEALATGVPVVQPQHGSFPEVVTRTGGGLLVPPRDPQALAEAWQRLRNDVSLRRGHGRQGAEQVRIWHSPQALARATVEQIEALRRAGTESRTESTA